MAKKTILPILALLLAVPVLAVQLDLDNPYGVAVVAENGVGQGMNYVVCTDGSGYMVENQKYGAWTTFKPSPVPLDQVVDWTPWTLYTTDCRWFARSASMDVWEEMGVDMEIPPPPCFVPVPEQKSSLGGVKSQYR